MNGREKEKKFTYHHNHHQSFHCISIGHVLLMWARDEEEGRSSYDFGHVGSMLMDIDMNEIVPVQNWGAANE